MCCKIFDLEEELNLPVILQMFHSSWLDEPFDCARF